MSPLLENLFDYAMEAHSNFFPNTPQWHQLIKQAVDLEHKLLAYLDEPGHAIWKEYQSVDGEVSDIERESFFLYAVTLGIELGRLTGYTPSPRP